MISATTCKGADDNESVTGIYEAVGRPLSRL